jgi:hypothetical protein
MPPTEYTNGEGDLVEYSPYFTGQERFSYKVSDGVDDSLNSAVITLTVNTPPEAEDDVGSVKSGESVTILVMLNDSDLDGHDLTLASLDDTGLIGGAATLNGDNTISYQADSGFSGTDALEYTIEDELGGSATATITITVTEDSDNPDGGDDRQVSTSSSDGGGGGGALDAWVLYLLILFAGFVRVARGSMS